MPRVTPASPNYSPGLFERLRAEDEPWLSEVYLPPGSYDQFLAHSSMIIVGARGSGKTALRLAISRHASQEHPDRKILIVDWTPEPPDEALEEPQLAAFAKKQAMAACADALMRMFGNQPQLLSNAPEWALDGLVWFLSAFLPADPQFLLLLYGETFSDEGRAALSALLHRPERSISRSHTSYSVVMNILLQVLSALNISAVWILVDGLEKWSLGLEQRLSRLLSALLDTLNFFEKPGFVFKAFVPAHLAEVHYNTGGVEKWRLQPLRLEWTVEELSTIVERRFIAAHGLKPIAIANISADPNFFNWLERHAGNSPREWLRLAYPFLRAYQQKSEANDPLTESEWRTIAWQNPPQLHIDPTTRKLFLGEGEVILPTASFEILDYLYRNLGRYCSREEIYYRVMRGLDYVPDHVKDTNYENSDSWSGRFDTAIWRLREKIEPRTESPVYIVTYRRRGLRLENAW